MHCLQHFWNSHVALSAHTTKTRVQFLLGFENLAVDFEKISNAREAFFFGCFTVTDVSQSTGYFLIISAKPELKLGQHLVYGHMVNVNTVVNLRHRRN